jgi:hypothetical protein
MSETQCSRTHHQLDVSNHNPAVHVLLQPTRHSKVVHVFVGRRSSTTEHVLRHTLHILNNELYLRPATARTDLSTSCIRIWPTGLAASGRATHAISSASIQCPQTQVLKMKAIWRLRQIFGRLPPARPISLLSPTSHDSFRRSVARRYGWWCNGHLWIDMTSTGV